MLELSPSSVEGVRRRPVAHVGGGGDLVDVSLIEMVRGGREGDLR